jgi:hypothetical protein
VTAIDLVEAGDKLASIAGEAISKSQAEMHVLALHRSSSSMGVGGKRNERNEPLWTLVAPEAAAVLSGLCSERALPREQIGSSSASRAGRFVST